MPDLSVPGRPPAWHPSARRPAVDWNLTVLAACSFLLHFGAFASLYSDWADEVVDDDLTVSRLVEATREDQPALPVERPEEEALPSPATPGATASPRPAHAGERRSAARGRAPAPPPRDAVADLSAELGRLDTAMLVALRSRGPATDDVLSGSSPPFGDLDVSDRAAHPRPALDLAFGASPRLGSSSTSLADLGNAGRGDGPASAGSARSVEGPARKPAVGVGDPAPTEIPGAGAVIAGLSGVFRRCYQNGLLRENPDMEGAVRVTARVGSNGEVVSVTSSATGSISPGVAACIASKVQGAQFSPPKNGQGAVLVIPVGLKHQAPP